MFVSGMKQTVSDLRQVNAEDITGARFAWLGMATPAERQREKETERKRQEVERQAKVEAERRRQEEELRAKREAEQLAAALEAELAAHKPETTESEQFGREEKKPHKKDKMR